MFDDYKVRMTATDLSAGREFDKLSRKIRRTDRDLGAVGRSADRLGKTLRTIGAASAAYFSARAFTGLVAGAFDYADAVDKASISTGIGVEALQEYRFAAEQLGIQANFLDDAFARFNKRLNDLALTGSGAGKKGFEELGLVSDFTSGKLKTTEEALEAAIARLLEYETSGQRAALSAELFGALAGPKMARLLAEGADGLDHWRSRASVMSEAAIRDAVRLRDEYTAATDAIERAFQVAIVNVVRSMKGLRMIWGEVTGDTAKQTTPQLKANLLEHTGRLQQLTTDLRRLEGVDRGDHPLAQQRRDEIAVTKEYIAEIERALDRRRALKRLEDELAGSNGGGGGGGGGAASAPATEAERAAEQLDKLIERRDLRVDGLRFELSLIGKTEEAQADLNAKYRAELRLQERRALAYEAGVDVNAEYFSSLEDMAREETELERAIRAKTAAQEAANKATEDAKKATDDMARSLSNAFAQVRSGKDALNAILTLGIQGAFGQGALGASVNKSLGVESGGIVGTLFNAKGNAFDAGGRVEMFAAGGVVDRRTPFTYGGGRRGVMGEAGPEAVMPLARGRGGRLGVEVSGGAPAPVVKVMVETHTSRPVEVRQEQGPDMLNIVIEEVADGVNKVGSPIYRALEARGV